MNNQKASVSLSLVVALLVFCIGCTPEKEELPPMEPFDKYIEVVSRHMCDKMYQCSAKMFRTLPGDKQAALTADNCVATVNANKELKLKKHTPKMKKYAYLCYNALLQSEDCKEFGQFLLLHPACSELKFMADKAYAGLPHPVKSLPWE